MLRELKNQKGFTLIELLIVIVIIGILAGIVIGLTGANARKKANDSRAKADMHELQTALEQYFSDNNRYPTDLTWQDTLVNNGYLKEVKTPPVPNKSYDYISDGTTYTLKYTLENTKDTGPNIVNGDYTLTERQ